MRKYNEYIRKSDALKQAEIMRKRNYWKHVQVKVRQKNGSKRYDIYVEK